MATKEKGLRLVSMLEASKGLISLLVGLGLHAFAGHNLRHVAEMIVSHLHLNPASRLPNIFIHAAGSITDSEITWVALGAFAYALVRFVEAYGLWRGMLWTEWFALVSGGIYLPFELYESVVHPQILSLGVLLINLIVVWYMARLLFTKE
ncbi:DUF2127 domain-containing protein [Vibrio sp. PP-XX7]